MAPILGTYATQPLFPSIPHPNMATIATIYGNVHEFYALDGMRADGFSVRFARLDMLNPPLSPIWALCWAMEIMVYVALYVPRLRGFAAVAFYVAYLGIWLLLP